MTIAPEPMSDKINSRLLVYFQKLNEDQRKIVLHDDGPLLVIAGLGSGKTECLTLRAMNLLLLKKAKLTELIVCTYTEKAAFEIQDRLLDTAQSAGYYGNISLIRVGTVNSICERIIRENLHRMLTHDYQGLLIGDSFETLDRKLNSLIIMTQYNAPHYWLALSNCELRSLRYMAGYILVIQRYSNYQHT